MKKYLVLLIVIFSLFFLLSCDLNTDDDNGGGGGVFTYSTVIKYGVSVQFVTESSSAKDGIENVENVTMEITGPDAGLVKTISGSTDFEVENGFICLDLVSDVSPSESNPVSFNIVAKASGYLTTIQPVLIEDTSLQVLVVNMLNLNDPPEGVSVKQQSFSVGDDGLSEEVTIETSLENKPEGAIIKFEEGTKFLDEAGNPVTGNIIATIVHFDNRSESSLINFPGGYTAYSAKDSLGNTMDPIVFATAGFMSMDFETESKVKIDSFSKPMEMTVGLNDTTHNPDNNDLTIQKGESLPVWCMDPETGTWKNLGNSNIEESEGKYWHYYYRWRWYRWHYWWHWGWYWWRCNVGARIDIHSNITKGSYYDNYYFCRAVSHYYGTRWRGYHRFFDGHKLYCRWWRYSDNINFIAYLRHNWYWWYYGWYGGILGQTGYFNACTDNPQMQIHHPFANQPIEITVKAYCPDNPNINVTPSLIVYYRDIGSYWKYLGYVRKGHLKTTKLAINHTYEFGTWFDGKWYHVNFTFNKDSYFWEFYLSQSFCEQYL